MNYFRMNFDFETHHTLKIPKHPKLREIPQYPYHITIPHDSPEFGKQLGTPSPGQGGEPA